ncbi:MAG: CoA transferase [Thermomicrobia bacterium]|nr:CoA transferase [Thermomicrobia bacterium]
MNLEGDQTTQPALQGIRVLEMGTLIAGPFAARILGDFGAEVIKIEPPVHGDPHREWGAMTDKGALWFPIQARNKRSVTVDLRMPEGQTIIRRLARECDILIENFRPGSLEKWNLGPDVLREENPRLIMVRISGFGQTGPYRFSLLQDALPQYTTLGTIQERTGNDLFKTAPSNVYQTKDGVWMAISGNNNSIFVRLMNAIERPDLHRDPRLQTNPGRAEHARMLDEAIGEWAREHTAAEVGETLEAAEVPFGPVYTIADIANDPQYQAREMILDIPHPLFGSIAMPGIVPKLSDTPGEVKWPAPPLGADTNAVLRELAGVDDDELARLRAAGVI